MKLIFVHGWSVTNTNTYRDMPETIVSQGRALGLALDINHIHLGKYISFHDEVSIDDIARALQQALLELPGNENGIQPFSCITHSTGGPVMRYWANKYYGHQQLKGIPMQHLIMLAPANQGSALAALGQKRASRIKSWFAGVEPGQRVLDWLKLGSDGQYQLNKSALTFQYAQNGFYPFVITGQGIDTKAYDFINSYLVENGSDGVIRVCGANMNCRFISLTQTDQPISASSRASMTLKLDHNLVAQTPEDAPIAVLGGASHSGGTMGVLNSKKGRPIHAQVAQKILQCLQVTSAAGYNAVKQDWLQQTLAEQQQIPVGKKDRLGRYGMLVFRVRDNAGDVIANHDYDILLLAGDNYSPDVLPKGFFADRQANADSQALVYYVDIDKMLSIKQGKFGIAVVARPEKGFSYYRKAEFHATETMLSEIFAPNETTYIDITLQRYVDENVFRFDKATDKQGSFKNVKPSGKNV